MKRKDPTSKYDSYSDEELIVQNALGNEIAYQVLFKRYTPKAEKMARSASPYFNLFDKSDLRFAYLISFMNSVDSFKLGKGSFTSFLAICFEQSLYKDAKKNLFPNGGKYPLSLDSEDEEGRRLYDCVAKNEDLDDPKAYLEYYERLEELNKLPPSLSKRTGELVKLVIDGYTLIEASKVLGIPYRTCKEMFAKYKKWADGVAKKEM